MARIATVLAIVCAAAGIVLGQAASQEISSVENERARAIARADAAAVARLSGAEFFQIGSDGAVATKAAVTPAAPDSHFSDLKVQVVGAAAVATGVQDDPQPLRFLHVWHRENNAWKAVLVHNTPIGKRAPAAPGRKGNSGRDRMARRTHGG